MLILDEAAFIELPPLPNSSHARLESVALGPRRAVTLKLRPLIWTGQQGSYSLPLTVRLGGVASFDEVAAFFAAQRLPADVAQMDYATEYVSKPGSLFLELIFERVEARIAVHCHSITVTENSA